MAGLLTKQRWLESNDYGKELFVNEALAENARLQERAEDLEIKLGFFESAGFPTPQDALEKIDEYKAQSRLRGEALEPFMFCQDVQHKPAEYVTREMAVDAGEPTMAGTLLRGELSEPCLACDGCRARAAIDATPEEAKEKRDE